MEWFSPSALEHSIPCLLPCWVRMFLFWLLRRCVCISRSTFLSYCPFSLDNSSISMASLFTMRTLVPDLHLFIIPKYFKYSLFKQWCQTFLLANVITNINCITLFLLLRDSFLFLHSFNHSAIMSDSWHCFSHQYLALIPAAIPQAAALTFSAELLKSLNFSIPASPYHPKDLFQIHLLKYSFKAIAFLYVNIINPYH